MKKIFFIILLLLPAYLGAQQSINFGYLSQKEPYQFNFPLQGLGMSMPANMGFEKPSLGKGKSLLDMDKEVNYFFETTAVTSKDEFKFSVTSNDKTRMRLFLVPQKSFFANTYLERIRSRYPDLKKLPPLKNDLGQSVSYQIVIDNKAMNSYVYYYENCLYHFIIDADNSYFDVYESVIKSVKKKNFQKEIARYKQHKATKSLESIHKENDGRKTEKEPDLRSIAGKNKFDCVLVFPQEGFKMWLPKDYAYGVFARKLIDKSDEDIIEVYRADSDKKRSIHFNRFDGEYGSIILRTQFIKEAEGLTSRGFSDMGDPIKRIYSYWRDIEVMIDGVKAQGVYYGTKHSGSLELWFENDQAYFSMGIYNLKYDNLSFYDNWFSTMKIEDVKNRSKTKNAKPLSSVLNLVDKEKLMTFDNLNIPQTTPSSLGGFVCNLEKMDISVFLPGNASDYTYGINDTWGKGKLNLGAKGETDLNFKEGDNFICIRSSKSGYSVFLTVYPNHAKQYDVRREIDDRFDHDAYIIDNHEKLIKASILESNQGTEWGILIEKSEKKAVIFAGNEDYTIYYTLSASSAKQLEELLSTLRLSEMSN